MIYSLQKTLNIIESSKARFCALILAMLAAFLMGGGSRADIQSLIILRPLSFLILGYSAVILLRRGSARLNAPFYFLVCLITLIILQLVPLPEAIWSSLPNRVTFAEIADTVGIGSQWRPLTLSPSRTMNSLFSLTLPLAIVILCIAQERRFLDKTLYLPVILGGGSALLGFFQVLASDNSFLYTYSVTNNGSLVGLFANRNHNAIFLASLLPIMAALLAKGGRNRTTEKWKNFALLMFLVLLVPIIIMTGSRSGLILLALGIILSIVIFSKIFFQIWSKTLERYSLNKRKFGYSLAALSILILTMVAYLVWNSEAFFRITSIEFADDSRVLYFPYLVELAKNYFPFGSGFGSFEFVFKTIEPAALLGPKYLNQAHNDLLQISIEGGLPAILLVTGFGFWLIGTAAKLFMQLRNLSEKGTDTGRIYLGLASLAAIFLLIVGSAFDYPLRTPAIMAYLALLTCIVHSVVKIKPS